MRAVEVKILGVLSKIEAELIKQSHMSNALQDKNIAIISRIIIGISISTSKLHANVNKLKSKL